MNAKRSLILFGVLLSGFLVPPVTAEELQLNAIALFRSAVTRDIRINTDGSALELEEGELIEDDGPAAGYSYLPNEERLSERVWIRKELVIANPRARKATLLVGPGGDMKATINGTSTELRSAGKVGGYWSSYAIPVEFLKSGKNVIDLHGSGRGWIARAEDFSTGSDTKTEHPNRSSKSRDGGKTWDAAHLGPNGTLDGEYCVRLFLDHYRRSGSLTLPVLDMGNLGDQVVAPPLKRTGPLRVRAQVELGVAGQVSLRVRSGRTPIPDAKSWSDWHPLSGDRGEIKEPTGRYFQLAVELSTNDPLQTPRLKGLWVEATTDKAADWTDRMKVQEARNEEIVRSSLSFPYEPFQHPRLKELRTRYHLDEVVKGAGDELELMTRLARWSARQWTRGHLKESYPPWDALEILKPHGDGNPVGGFCQQYNLVFLQACECFGIPGRAVSISVGDHGGQIRGSGHEVVELWSNQFRKWVYIDGNMAWYAVDQATGIPLSLWELRQRQVKALRGNEFAPIRVVHLAEGGKRWTGLMDWPPFLELRLIPRSNFLEQKAPLPLNQGMRGWFWTGHHVWSDTAYPASLLYSRLISNRRNWEWTLNQAHYVLEATDRPGELRVHLDTETPSFESFLVDAGQGKQQTSSGFLWKLQLGKNRLEVGPRNSAGREGIPSVVVLDYR